MEHILSDLSVQQLEDLFNDWNVEGVDHSIVERAEVFIDPYGSMIYDKLAEEDYRQEEIKTFQDLRSIVLFIGASIKIYHDSLTKDAEKTPLIQILNQLKILYMNNGGLSETNVKNTLKSITQESTSWLTKYASKSEDLKFAKQTCVRLFIGCKLLKTNGQALTEPFERNIVHFRSLYKFSPNQIDTFLTPIIEQLSKGVDDIPKRIAQIEEASIEPERPFFEKLNDTYVELLKSDDTDRFKQASGILLNNAKTLTKLHRATENKKALLEKLNQIKTIQYCIVDNTQAAYLKDLLTDPQYMNGFTNIFSYFNPEQTNTWSALKNQIEDPSISSRAGSALSYITQYPVSWYHRLTPNFIQGVINSIAPDTVDSQAKGWLLEQLQILEVETNQSLQQHSIEIETDINHLVEQVTIEEDEQKTLRSELKEQIEQDLSVLENISTATYEAAEITSEFDVLINDYQFNSNQANLASGIEQDINKFIASYDDFWVKISNFLAQFIAIFKSDTAKQIDELKKINKEIKAIKKENHKNADSDFSKVHDNKTLHKNIRTTLADTLQATSSDNEPKPKTNMTRDAFFNAIKNSKSEYDENLKQTLPSL
jgi:hypothetical protein